jgi:hypothetical protein
MRQERTIANYPGIIGMSFHRGDRRFKAISLFNNDIGELLGGELIRLIKLD